MKRDDQRACSLDIGLPQQHVPEKTTQPREKHPRMNILFLSHYFPPEVNAPASRTYEHCKRWVAAGHSVTVITCVPNCPNGVVFPPYRNVWRNEETVDGIRVIRVWTWLAANKGFVSRIANYVSYLINATLCTIRLKKIDVVVATSPQFFCGWAGVLCHWLRRWPFVLEIRDIWPESIVTVGAMRRSRVIRLLEWLELRMYRDADHIVTVGAGYRQQLLDRGVPAGKLSVIPNGVDCSQLDHPVDASELRQQWASPHQTICTYIGTIGMAHGLEVVLNAATILKQQDRSDIMFWIVGDGAERERLQTAAANRDLDNVRFTGMVAKEDVPQVIANSDCCLVHLKGTELFGTVIPSKIFEIMAQNVPIVMGVRGEALQIVLSAAAGVAMTPDDPESFIQGIDSITSNKAHASNGRNYVNRFYNRDKLAAEMLKVLQTIVAPSARDVEATPQANPTSELAKSPIWRKSA